MIGGFCRQLIGNFRIFSSFINFVFSFVGNVGDIYVDVGSLKMNKDNEAGEFKPGIGIERDCPVSYIFVSGLSHHAGFVPVMSRPTDFRSETVPYHGFFFRGTITICPGLTRAIMFETVH